MVLVVVMDREEEEEGREDEKWENALDWKTNTACYSNKNITCHGRDYRGTIEGL